MNSINKKTILSVNSAAVAIPSMETFQKAPANNPTDIINTLLRLISSPSPPTKAKEKSRLYQIKTFARAFQMEKATLTRRNGNGEGG